MDTSIKISRSPTKLKRSVGDPSPTSLVSKAKRSMSLSPTKINSLIKDCDMLKEIASIYGSKLPDQQKIILIDKLVPNFADTSRNELVSKFKTKKKDYSISEISKDEVNIEIKNINYNEVMFGLGKSKKFKCAKCKKEKKESEGSFIWGGKTFCCKKCCPKGKEGKKKEKEGTCEFC
mgnify:CR=1 FL=1